MNFCKMMNNYDENDFLQNDEFLMIFGWQKKSFYDEQAATSCGH